jgi:sensor histidine kinase regulating citrate/malate metabolism
MDNAAMALLDRLRASSVAAQILRLQLVVVAVVVLGGLLLAYVDARRDAVRSAGDVTLGVSETMAASPTVRAAVRTEDPTTVLQPYAEQVRRSTGTSFVVVMSPQGIRWTHPDSSQIGAHYLGSMDAALAGGTLTEEYTGTLGPSVRSVAPVLDADGRVIALVSVGITTASVQSSLWSSLPSILIAGLAALAVGVIGAFLVSRRLRRQTHGLASTQLTAMLEYYDAVLHAVREGMLLLDRDGRVQLVNDEARRLLALDDDAVGRPLSDLDLPTSFVERAGSRVEVRDEIQLVHDKILVVNRTMASWAGKEVGSVITVRDRTDLQAISGELDSARSLADSLRAQNHEAANRLQTVVSLIELGRPEAAVEFATAELELTQRLTDRVVAAVDDPVLAAMLLGKTAQAAERGIELAVTDGSVVAEHDFEPQDLVTLFGNLIDNAMDAAADSDRARRVDVGCELHGDRLSLRVGDSGPGLTPAQRHQVFTRGWSTKPGADGLGRGIGLALVTEVVRRLGGSIVIRDSSLGGALFCVDIPADGAGAEDLLETTTAKTVRQSGART